MKIIVTDRWGGKNIIAIDDYLNPRKIVIPLYTNTGQKLSHYYEKMGWHNKATCLHRANIVSVPDGLPIPDNPETFNMKVNDLIGAIEGKP